MNTVERYTATFKGERADRVPIAAWLGLPLLQTLSGLSIPAILKRIVEEPDWLIGIQEGMGLDPIMITVDDRWFSMHNFWRMLYSFPDEALETWRVTEQVTESGPGFASYEFTAATPDGPVTWGYQVGGAQVAEMERPIKEEEDLDLLIKHMPVPESLNQDKLTALVQATGNRAFFTHNFIGVWGEAANMRGLVTLCTDLFDRPDFVKRLSEFLMERSIRRVRHLAQTGVHSILYDQSWVGVGLSPQVYREFMLPYDQQVVRAAQDAGILVSYHNCGRGSLFLEDMVSTGADAIETLTPKTSSGDFDLADVKRRVGGQITLNGGFNERILAESSVQEIKDEVRRCLDAAAADGRYILRTCGQIFDAPPGTIEAFTDAGRQYGVN
jgi:uroporphyrinogen-III decarboxylase